MKLNIGNGLFHTFLVLALVGCGDPHATRKAAGGAGDVGPGVPSTERDPNSPARGIGDNPIDRVGDDEAPPEGEEIGGAGDGRHGSSCDDRSDCEGGTCLNLPGGYCTQLGCAVDAECGDGAVCMEVDRGGTRACLAVCGDGLGCRAGYACNDDGVCLPGIDDIQPHDNDATDGDETAPVDDGLSVGAGCRSDDECTGPQDRRICLTVDDGFPGGYCTLLDCRPGSCPDGAECFQVNDAGLTACLDTCSEGGCRDGYECRGGRACMPEQEARDDDPIDDPVDEDPIDDPVDDGFGAPIGGECRGDADCASEGATCLPEEDGFPGGYCVVVECQQGSCPAGSDCFQVSEDGSTACLATCDAGCRAGYECVQGLACLPVREGDDPGGDDPADGSPIGGACAGAADCVDDGAVCLDDAQGFQDGYCALFDCGVAGCPAGSDCFQIAEDGTTACLATCDGGCRDGYECVQDLACMPAGGAGGGGAAACEGDADCEGDEECVAGRCIVPVGDVPDGPVPAGCRTGVGDIPDWRCDDGERACGRVVPFAPDLGPGWWDYPLNGETNQDQYRSYIRQDVMQLVQYGAAMVDCLSADWDFGNLEPLGLGDMSEANGAIPGTREGQPGHPQGTHVNGHDMDIAYYQLGTPDNRLRSVCDHVSGGRDQYHCVAEPHLLDPWRTALFIALLHDSPQLRVVGVDGQVGPIVEAAAAQLCAEGWIDDSNPTCRGRFALAYETVDEGRGWYRFHHHHLHISLIGQGQSLSVDDASTVWGPNACITLDCSSIE